MRSMINSKCMIIIGLVLSFMLTTAQAQAQGRKDKPSGAEIAAKAKMVRFNSQKAATGQRNGKTVKFTPVDSSRGAQTAMNSNGSYMMAANFMVPSTDPTSPQTTTLADGVIIGQLDTTQADAQMPLDPGVYNIMVAQVNGVWSAYLESGGVYIGEYIAVDVQSAPAGTIDGTTVITPDWDLETAVATAPVTASYLTGARNVAASWMGQTSATASVNIGSINGAATVTSASPMPGTVISSAMTPEGPIFSTEQKVTVSTPTLSITAVRLSATATSPEATLPAKPGPPRPANLPAPVGPPVVTVIVPLNPGQVYAYSQPIDKSQSSVVSFAILGGTNNGTIAVTPRPTLIKKR
jgi:hypothetical protein